MATDGLGTLENRLKAWRRRTGLNSLGCIVAALKQGTPRVCDEIQTEIHADMATILKEIHRADSPPKGGVILLGETGDDHIVVRSES